MNIIKRLVLVTIFSIYFFIFCNSHLVFSQGKEYERFRAFDGQTPFVGQELRAEYYLGIGDKLKIFVWKNPDLSTISTINPDGMLYYPLISGVKAAGLTVEQLRDKMKEKFSTYIRYPDITITVEKLAGKKIIILGEVQYPGIYTYEGRIDLFEALGLVGGFTRDAKRESVIVVSKNLTENPQVRRVNLFQAIRKGASSREVMLEHNDIVYVPRHFVADFTEVMRNLNVWFDTEDKLLSGLWDWRKELQWLHKRNTR